MNARIAWAAIVASSLLLGSSAASRALAAEDPPQDPGYVFTQDVFSRSIPVWSRVLAPYKDKENVRYLEVGVFEGRSFLWVLDNILTHPTTEAWAVDLFHAKFFETFLQNLVQSGHAQKVNVQRGDSREVLRRLPTRHFDIVYIDGGHEAQYVLNDAVLAWELLKDGGLLIFDDYRFDQRLPWALDYHLPGMAIDTFVSAYVDEIEMVYDGYQRILRKKQDPCNVFACAPFGQYVYNSYARQLRKISDGKRVQLSNDERDVLEAFLRTRPRGEIRFAPSSAFLSSPAWQKLAGRLQIEGFESLVVSPEELEASRLRQAEDF